MARCFFSRATKRIKYENYEKYYKKEAKNTIGDNH